MYVLLYKLHVLVKELLICELNGVSLNRNVGFRTKIGSSNHECLLNYIYVYVADLFKVFEHREVA